MNGTPPTFGPAVRAWFDARHRSATRVQELGWPRIAAGEHALLCAPTGSGKTLAAFLSCIDRLGQAPGGGAGGTRVVYVSPLKALAYDIERNLTAPLAEIAELAAARGLDFRPPSIGVRTGDTSAAARRKQLREPPEILITTPESLYLLLTSSAREGLAEVDTVIVDEIHALVPNKRGAHLALSLERLAALCRRDPQRIGLSATQRPLEEVARYLGGDRPVAIVDAGEAPRIDLAVVAPAADMRRPAIPADEEALTPQERASLMPSVFRQVYELVAQHRSTIVFVNSRRQAERIAHQLNEVAGEEIARAHHGSVARGERLEVEDLLKRGLLRCICATSSLELGIDMSAVDLVIQVESPGSVSRGLQRIGRAGHAVGAVSVGRIMPIWRGDLVEAAAVCRAMLDGEVEETRAPRQPLDVLAQQIVAMAAVDGWQVDALLRLVRRAHGYRDLTRAALDAVLDMLSGRYPADEMADLAPRLAWDRAADTITARRGARIVALTSGGTIPDRGLYAVHLGGPDGPRVGELDEEMVYESRAGDTFLLGATTWRIEEIGRDRVIVSPAPGEPGRMPFWKGDRPGRPAPLGRRVGALIRRLDEMSPDEARDHLAHQHRLDGWAIDNLVGYLAEQREATGALPTDRAVTIERFRDELGDFRVCILSPLGARVHAPWALAIEAELGPSLGAPIQVLWNDDGIAFRLPASDRPLEWERLLPDPDRVEDAVTAELAATPLFASHFRENAARALLLPRRRAGQRMPLYAQRLRAQQLLGAAQKHPGFPIVLETYREILRDVFDLPALLDLLRAIQAGSVRVDVVDTQAPSPFAR
ncbi:MAG TPA: DEAD/DEAH box helicase, partial [Kofleriaceae bacterium]|nr:DEAD/DEAH box helicase [Kofleriaceae bacterium]